MFIFVFAGARARVSVCGRLCVRACTREWVDVFICISERLKEIKINYMLLNHLLLTNQVETNLAQFATVSL